MTKYPRMNKDKALVLRRIANRASEMAHEHGIEYDTFTALMDLNAVQLNVPLRLDELAAADDFNFAHDMFGIRRHLNRQTFELENCFLPRYAAF